MQLLHPVGNIYGRNPVLVEDVGVRTSAGPCEMRLYPTPGEDSMNFRKGSFFDIVKDLYSTAFEMENLA